MRSSFCVAPLVQGEAVKATFNPLLPFPQGDGWVLSTPSLRLIFSIGFSTPVVLGLLLLFVTVPQAERVETSTACGFCLPHAPALGRVSPFDALELPPPSVGKSMGLKAGASARNCRRASLTEVFGFSSRFAHGAIVVFVTLDSTCSLRAPLTKVLGISSRFAHGAIVVFGSARFAMVFTRTPSLILHRRLTALARRSCCFRLIAARPRR